MAWALSALAVLFVFACVIAYLVYNAPIYGPDERPQRDADAPEYGER